jgi:uncharacterized protein (TIGR02147 family)
MQDLNYRTILTNEYEARASMNKSYSMRAYARDLDLSASQLNDILKGRKGLSTTKSVLVAKNLGLENDEILVFKALVEKIHGRSERIKKLAISFLEESTYKNNFKTLSQDSYNILSDWYHFAILSCMELSTYDGTIDFLVQKLDLEFETVESAIKRMLREEMIDLNKGKFVVSDEMYTTTHNIESKALKNSHKQTLKQAIDCIDTIPVELRDITSMTMAIDRNKLPEAKKLITDFRRKMSCFLESGIKEDVYNINIQLVPVSKVQ